MFYIPLVTILEHIYHDFRHMTAPAVPGTLGVPQREGNRGGRSEPSLRCSIRSRPAGAAVVVMSVPLSPVRPNQYGTSL